MDSKFRALLLDAPQFPVDVVQQDATFTGLWEALAGITELGYAAAYESAFKYLHWVYVLSQRGEEIHRYEENSSHFRAGCHHYSYHFWKQVTQ
jgi:hypothetical protein